MFVDLFGPLLIGGICLWAVLFASKELVRLVSTGTTFDRTLAPVPREDHPRLFALHVFGVVIFIVANARIGIDCMNLATMNSPPAKQKEQAEQFDAIPATWESTSDPGME